MNRYTVYKACNVKEIVFKISNIFCITKNNISVNAHFMVPMVFMLHALPTISYFDKTYFEILTLY